MPPPCPAEFPSTDGSPAIRKRRSSLGELSKGGPDVPATGGGDSKPPTSEVAKTSTVTEMKIRDRVYDVTDFVKKHPGGSIIKYYAGQDATDVYEAFHFRSKIAEKYLDLLPSRAVSKSDKFLDKNGDDLMKAFRDYKQDLLDEGMFDPSIPHVIFRIFQLVLLFTIHFFLLSRGYTWTSAIIGGLACGQSGWVQHEGGHNSLTGVMWVDKLIQKAAISFGLVTSNAKWNNWHNKHHATPQKEDFDVDVDTLPFVAFYKEALIRGRRLWMTPHWWIRYQHITFLPISTVVNVFFWHFYLHPVEYLIRRPDMLTFALVISRYVVHFYIALPVYGIAGSMATLLFSLFFAGMYLFGNFSLNHTYLPTTRAHEERNWMEYGIDYTVNIDPNPLVNWWMGYLNCQVEHHLFPSMPQYRQPRITKRTRALCERFGLKYQSVSYFKAIYLMLSNLRNVGSTV